MLNECFAAAVPAVKTPYGAMLTASSRRALVTFNKVVISLIRGTCCRRRTCAAGSDLPTCRGAS